MGISIWKCKGERDEDGTEIERKGDFFAVKSYTRPQGVLLSRPALTVI